MNDIDDIIDAIQKQLQRDGISAAMTEIGEVARMVSGLQDLIGTLESSGDYDGVLPVRNATRAVQAELENVRRMVGYPESVLNEAVYRIRNA